MEYVLLVKVASDIQQYRILVSILLNRYWNLVPWKLKIVV